MSKKGLSAVFDVQSSKLKPLWIRIVIVAFTTVWTGFEIASGNTIWAIIFGAASAYLAHQFFIAFDPPDETGEADTTDKTET